MSDFEVKNSHLDFLRISTRSVKKGVVQIYPHFDVRSCKDLMIRGGDFYAIWLEKKGIWSTNESDAIDAIDDELRNYYNNFKENITDHIDVQYMWDSDSGAIDKWHKFVQKQARDNYHILNSHLTFANSEPNKMDYASKRLPYPIEEGPCDAWKEITSVLYSPEELHKIEWSIGAIVTGDSKKLQKFVVMYGPPGTGKSTILDVIEHLFEGYCAVFNAKALGQANASFSLEPLKDNPLVAIQHDGDLSKIEDNTVLNSLTSHERMVVNTKHMKLFEMKFNSFVFLGTNKPVKITDAKSGITRRLIDVYPTGNTVPAKKYNQLKNQVKFELGHIAQHCKEVYLENPHFYDEYKPIRMMIETNDVFNFVDEYSVIFAKDDGVTLKQAYDLYKLYCDEAKVPYPMSRMLFQAELRNYFEEYYDRFRVDGVQVRSYYRGLKRSMLDGKKNITNKPSIEQKVDGWLDLTEQPSKLDIFCKDCPAQEATEKETPKFKWDNVRTTLKDIDTQKVHYLKVPQNLIVIDFDMKDIDGNKSYELNKKEASKWPKTYAETSKSGGGIHLHYIYNGDVSRLSRLYADDIEIKVFTGNSSLRRKLSICNNLDIATISSGLPTREVKMNKEETIKDEKHLIAVIMKCLRKETKHSATKPNVDLIYKTLEDAYENGIKYDVSNLKQWIISFAASSSHQSDYCIDLVSKMHFKSDEAGEYVESEDESLNIYDVEVYRNRFIVCWSSMEEDDSIVHVMIDPSVPQMEKFMRLKLGGFNCRKYDNHICYGSSLGYTNEQLYQLSKKIINEHDGYFANAYNASYIDLYDCSSKKQSLKKWEIELGLHHKEMEWDWDQPLPDELLDEVVEYCKNDVRATKAVYRAIEDDIMAREILADLTGMPVNTTTNTLTTKFIFGDNKNPQLVYTDLSEEFPGYKFEKVWNDSTRKYEYHNWYRGIDLGFGGWIYSDPGMYGNVGLLDVKSLHPHSAIALNIFGEYTPRFKELVDVRVAIKEGRYEDAKKMFDGKLTKYLNDKSHAKKLSKALKIAINSVYGLTSAKFDNPFRDARNENNIVALRGALFMKTLFDEVVAKGYKVAHIKTDSIKIVDMDEEIKDFCMEFAKKYGYEFDHEATYEKMALVNDAVYIAKYREKDGQPCSDWTATGTQFAVPYVFKSCFSHEPIVFRDKCEAKEVKSVIYMDYNEYTPDNRLYEKLKDVRKKQSNGKNLNKREMAMIDEYSHITDKELDDIFSTSHRYRFVGRVGLFCPIQKDIRTIAKHIIELRASHDLNDDEKDILKKYESVSDETLINLLSSDGGAILLRQQMLKDGSTALYAVTGTDGYRWMEAEDVSAMGLEPFIDLTYYHKLVNNAIDNISKYGDYEWFASDAPYISPENTQEKNDYESVMDVADSNCPF